jgi:membrane-associated HD superfamily phosphohydrolase
MATRKPKDTELHAAAANLAEAAHHLRQAVTERIDAFASAATLELDRARKATAAQGGQASRDFDALMRRAQQQLTKTTNAAKKSLHKAVRESEKMLQAMDKTVQNDLARLRGTAEARMAAGKTAARKATAAKTPAKRPLARTAPARPAPAKKAAARKAAARKAAA